MELRGKRRLRSETATATEEVQEDLVSKVQGSEAPNKAVLPLTGSDGCEQWRTTWNPDTTGTSEGVRLGWVWRGNWWWVSGWV